MNSLKVERAEKIFRKYFMTFLMELKTPKVFNYSTARSELIINEIISEIELMDYVEIKVLSHPWPNSLAWFTASEPYTIFLNARNLDRTLASIAGSIAHEYIHLADYHCKKYKFGHPKRRFWNKSKVLNSAPYFVGREFSYFILQI